MNYLGLIFLFVVLFFSLALLFWQLSLLFVSVYSVPTVYAFDRAIIDAYKLVDLKKDELVIDLGCGNAKSLIIAAKKFKAWGVGVEISPYCFLKSKWNVWRSGQSKNIKIIFGDFKKAEKYLKKADVVYLYLLNKTLAKIEDWYFKSISKKTRTVVLSFQFRKHKPAKTSKTINLNRQTQLSLYKPLLDKKLNVK